MLSASAGDAGWRWGLWATQQDHEEENLGAPSSLALCLAPSWCLSPTGMREAEFGLDPGAVGKGT